MIGEGTIITNGINGIQYNVGPGLRVPCNNFRNNIRRTHSHRQIIDASGITSHRDYKNFATGNIRFTEL